MHTGNAHANIVHSESSMQIAHIDHKHMKTAKAYGTRNIQTTGITFHVISHKAVSKRIEATMHIAYTKTDYL